MWTGLLLVLSKKHLHPEASQMLEIAPCLSSMIVDPLFAIASSTTITDSMDNMLWTVYYLCSADNKSNAEAEEVCGAFYDAGVVGRLVELACSGLSDGIVYIALANINHHFVQDDEHKEAVIDAGFLDSAHRFFDGECTDNVTMQACGILCDLVESKCICSHGTALAGLCKKMTFIALEAESALEEQAMTFFQSLLENLCVRFLIVLFEAGKSGEEFSQIKSLVDDLVDKDLVELLIIKLDTANIDITRLTLLSIDWILMHGRLKDGADYSPVFPGSQIAALEWHEDEDIQEMSSRIVRGWYPQLTWKAIEKRAKKAEKAKRKRNSKLCGWPSLCFFKK